MKIGIDMDGVLCDFVHGYNALVKQEFGITLDYPAKTWNWHEWGFKGAGMDEQAIKDAVAKLWEIIKATPFQGSLLPLRGALDAIERLNALSIQGNDIYFITNRSGKLAKFWSELWLHRHGMETPTVIVVKNKAVIVHELGIEVFVDDMPENCEAVTNLQKNYEHKVRVYMPDHPYNRIAADPKVYGVRVKDLNEVLDIEFNEQRRAA